jgi:hypothetical protein
MHKKWREDKGRQKKENPGLKRDRTKRIRMKRSGKQGQKGKEERQKKGKVGG